MHPTDMRGVPASWLTGRVLTYNLAKLFLHLMYTCKYELNLFDDG